MMDIGANVGAITRMMKEYFPAASVHAFEPVHELADIALANTQRLADVRVLKQAVTNEHLFEDDFGQQPREKRVPMRLFRGTPAGGPGWIGGSVVVPDTHPMVTGNAPSSSYVRDPQRVSAITLDDVVERVLKYESAREIDIVKFDCEGCEHSALGGASRKTLQRLRFIVGEYHDIQRFARIMKEKLFATHKVNLIGDRSLGAFFAERRDGDADGILLARNDGMLVPRPWLGDEPIEWHLFNPEYVVPQERGAHALG
jgi:FkbM family methyltransferase